MHELGIANSVVAIVAEHAGRRRVRRVTLEVGALAGVMTDAVEFCWDLVTRDTVAEGATLEILQIEARALCRSCRREFPQDTLYTPCPCGSVAFERLSGEELNVKEFECASADEAEPALAGR